MSRILVVGAAGTLGHKLCQEFPRRGHEVIGTVRRPDSALARVAPHARVIVGVDVLEGDALERAVRDARPEFVVNAVGIVKQLDAASNKHASTAVNAWLPHRLDRLCRELGARLLHISTDCVFSGRRGNYVESDPSDAEDIYGRSKWLGEPDAALTLRTSIIGRELKRPTHGLVEWFLDQKGKAVNGFAGAIYTGFTTIEMARIMALVIEKHPRISGLFHVASAPINKFDLLHLIRKAGGIEVEIRRDEAFVCDRSLLMSRFSEATGYRAPSWESMIREMCADPTPYADIQAQATRD